jgi:hypothetical protein
MRFLSGSSAGEDPPRRDSIDALEALLIGSPAPPAEGADARLLRCVSSGYLSNGCSCDAAVPAEAVVAAWARERLMDRGDRFFRFRWEDREWLGFGLRDGRVRGVYCPEHRAQRAEHEALERLEENAAERRFRAAALTLAQR